MWRAGPLKVTRRFLAAVEARDLAACGALMHDDFRYIDSRGNVLEGKAAGLELFERLMLFHGDSRIVVSSMTERRDCALIRGRVESSEERLAGESLWKLRVVKGLLCEIESHRFDTRPMARLLVPEILDRERDPET